MSQWMPFVEPPVDGDEAATLLGVLDRTRSVLAWKCDGLPPHAMSVRLGRSAITLGGLLKHLAFVEDHASTKRLSGSPLPARWRREDFEADQDWDWHSAADDTPGELFELWAGAVARCRAAVAEVLARDADLGQPIALVDDTGAHANLRRLLVDLIDEYARHNGHADLIRESIDGLVGEDPPR